MFSTQYSPGPQLAWVVISAAPLSMEMSPIDRNNHLASDHPGFANFSHNFIYQSPTLRAPPASPQIVILVWVFSITGAGLNFSHLKV